MILRRARVTGLRNALSRLALAAVPFLAWAAPTLAQSQPLKIELSTGVNQVLRGGDVAEGGLELRGRPLHFDGLPRLFSYTVPIGGAIATGDGSLYTYAGFELDYALTRRLTVTPNWAVGVYQQGAGRDLGGPVEFRSALDLTLWLTARTAIGLSFYHLSNAGIYDHNPGSESLVVTYTLAAGRRR
jgi:hypothetical protein